MAFTPVSHVHFSPGACLCLFVVVCLCVCVQPWFYLLESRGVFSFSKCCTEESEFGPRSLLPSSLLLPSLSFGCFVRFYATRWLLVGNVKLVLCHSCCGPFCGACHHLAISARWAGGERDETSFFFYYGTRGQTGASAGFHFSSTQQQQGRWFDEATVVVLTWLVNSRCQHLVTYSEECFNIKNVHHISLSM